MGAGDLRTLPDRALDVPVLLLRLHFAFQLDDPEKDVGRGTTLLREPTVEIVEADVEVQSELRVTVVVDHIGNGSCEEISVGHYNRHISKCCAFKRPVGLNSAEQRQPELRKLHRVRPDQSQQHCGVEGLDEIVVVAARLGAPSVAVFGVLPGDSDQHGSFAGLMLANLLSSIPSAFIRHRYIHDDYVRVEVANVRNDGARAVEALGVVAVVLKQGQQCSDHVLIVVHNENTGAMRHGETSYRRAADTVVKNGARAALRVARGGMSSPGGYLENHSRVTETSLAAMRNFFPVCKGNSNERRD
jgi:hypothetical protein